MALALNESARQQARDLIKGRQYRTDTDWSQAQPSTERENDYIARHGYEAYGHWHLGVNTDEPADTKKRYEFPYGDFDRLHRSGLIAAKQRAAHEYDTQIEQAADELLQSLPED